MNEAYDFFREDLVPALRHNTSGCWIFPNSAGAARPTGHLFRRKSFSRAHAAGVRSRPAVPAHLEPEPEHRGGGSRAGGGPEHFARVKIPDCLPQLLPVALHSAGRWTAARIRFRLARAIDHRQSAPPVSRSRDCAALTFSTSPATPKSPSRNWKPTICWKPSKKPSGSGDFATRSGCRWTRDMPASMIEILAEQSGSGCRQTFIRVDGPLDLSRLRHLLALDRPDLKDKPFLPAHAAGFCRQGRRYLRSDPPARPACCIIRTNRSSRWSNFCARPPRIPTCWRSR